MEVGIESQTLTFRDSLHIQEVLTVQPANL